MRTILTIALLIGLVGTMVFGAFLMLHGSDANDHGLCIPGIIDQSECDSAVGPLEYVRIHIGALSALTTFPTTATTVFLSLVALGLLGLFRYLIQKRGHSSLSVAAAHSGSFEIESSQSQKLLKWFAIHEKRDPSLLFRS